MHDLLGLGGELQPRFVKRYADLGAAAAAAVAAYADEVRSGAFPAAEHTYGAGGRVRQASAGTTGGYLGGVREDEPS